MPNNSFVLYTHASPAVGLGHLNRCLILGAALRRRGQTVALLCSPDAMAEQFAHGIDWSCTIDTNDPQAWPQADLCIVDRYCYDDRFYADLRQHYDLIAIFDDIEYRVPQHVAAVINTNVYADASRYPRGVRILAGAQFALLREEFKYQGRRHATQTNRVFVCVGGSDPERQMGRLLSIVTQTTQRHVVAVYGPGFEDRELIERWRQHPRVETHQAPTNLADLMAGTDYAVTAAGSMLYELAAVGLPVIAIGLADNQERLGQAFNHYGGCRYLGVHRQLQDSELAAAIEELDMDSRLLEVMEKAQQRVCDATGDDRLALELHGWLDLRSRPYKSPYSRDEVQAEYEESAIKEQEHEQVRWGSAESMANRHRHIIEQLPFKATHNWLDVGSGTGALQAAVLTRFANVQGVGLELSPGLVQRALARNLAQIQFVQQDFLDHQGQGYDLLTCIGVLAKTNIGLAEFFLKAADVVQVGGHVFVELKNRDWKRFREPDFYPEVRHLWFTEQEMTRAAVAGGQFMIERIYGYRSDTDQVVPSVDSHTVFLLARRLKTNRRAAHAGITNE